MPQSPANARRDTKPWWRFPLVWMVISGPALVVVASVASGIVAWRAMDTVVGSGVESVPSQSDPTRPDAPAHKARNHAASPRN